MRPPQKDFDIKPDFGTLLQKHRQLPFARFMDLISSKLDDLNDLLRTPSPFDQSPGRQVPYCIPVLYGPLPLTTPVRQNAETGLVDQTGFETLAKLATPDKFFLPRNGDILVGRELSVNINSLCAYGFVNWGYTTDPGFDVPYTNPRGVGDIFDAVGPDPSVDANGGAMPLDFFGGTFSTVSLPQPNLPNIAFEVELYDKVRGRRMHNNRLPVEMFQGGRLAHRRTPSPLVWKQGTKIEPRLFVTEIRMGSVLDGLTAYQAASVKAYVCLVFKGVQKVEIPNL